MSKPTSTNPLTLLLLLALISPMAAQDPSESGIYLAADGGDIATWPAFGLGLWSVSEFVPTQMNAGPSLAVSGPSALLQATGGGSFVDVFTPIISTPITNDPLDLIVSLSLASLGGSPPATVEVGISNFTDPLIEASVLVANQQVSIPLTIPLSNGSVQIRIRMIVPAGETSSAVWIDDFVLYKATPEVKSIAPIGPSSGAAPMTAFDLAFDSPVIGVDATDLATDTDLIGTAVLGVETEFGHGIDFESVADRLVATNVQASGGAASTDAVTIEFWMNSSFATSQHAMFSYAVPGEDNEILIALPHALGVWIGGQSLSTGVDAADGQWHHVAVTWSSTTGETNLYLDGSQRARGFLNVGGTIASGGTLMIAEEQDSVGGGLSTSQAFIGSMDEIRWWDAALDGVEIRANLFRALSGAEADLRSVWPLDQYESIVGGAVVDDMRDLGGNANHFQVLGSLDPLVPPQGAASRHRVTVSTGDGTQSGLLRVDVIDDGTVQHALSGNPLASGFDAGAPYFSCGAAQMVLSVPLDFPTIQAAIDAACDGARIEIASGFYNESLVIQGKSVDLIGLPDSDGAVGLTPLLAGFPSVSLFSVGFPSLTASSGGGRWEGISFQAFGASAVEISGAASVGIVIERCSILSDLPVSAAPNGAGVLITNSGPLTKVDIGSSLFIITPRSGIEVVGQAEVNVVGSTFIDDDSFIVSDPAFGINAPPGMNNVTVDACIFTSSFSPGTDDFAIGGPVTVANSFVADLANHTSIINAGGNFEGATGLVPLEQGLLAFLLDRNSQCIDTTAPSVTTYVPSTDILGNPRIRGSAIDAGAHEIWRPFPGTNEDLRFEISIGSAPEPPFLEFIEPIRSVSAPDTVQIGFSSPNGTFVAREPLILMQLFTTGGVLNPAYPGIALDNDVTPGIQVFLNGSDLGGLFGTVLIPPGGINVLVNVPGGLGGYSVMLQGLATTNIAANQIFASDDAKVIEFQ